MTLPYPVQPAPQPGRWIGQIGFTQDHVLLPTGTFPIRGSAWTLTDMSYPVQKISTTGIVLAVVLFPLFCAFSLLFLLMKDTSVAGSVNVTVSGSGFHFSTLVPVAGGHTVVLLTQEVNYARALADWPRA